MIRHLFWPTVSAILLAIPMFYGQLFILAFIGLIPLFFQISSKSAAYSFLSFYLFGLVYFGILTYPTFYVTVVGAIGMILYLALYPACFGYLAFFFVRKDTRLTETLFVRNAKNLWILPAFWAIFEYLRSWLFGGLPVALLAYSQWTNLAFIQVADMIGVYGVGFLVVLFNVLLMQIWQVIGIWKEESKEPSFVKTDIPKCLGFFLIVSLVLGGGVVLYGTIRLSNEEKFLSQTTDHSFVRVCVLQGNIPQKQKWNTRIKNTIFDRYVQLHTMGVLEKAHLIVWPETSFPGFLEDEALLTSKLRSLIRRTGVPTLIGAPTIGNMDQGLKLFNSAILFGMDGEERQRYHKMHLVPFGEYVPMEFLFGFTRYLADIGRFWPGQSAVVFETPGRFGAMPMRARFATLICYEDMFPWLVREFSAKGLDFLVNITNDAWFEDTQAPYQHAQASIFRAIENRLPMIRAANTGFSCFISPSGRILAHVENNGKANFVTGNKTYKLLLGNHFSFYRSFGDVFIWVALLGVALGFFNLSKRHRYSQV